MRKLIIAAGVVALGTACADVDSTDVLTSGIYADLWTVAEGDGTSRAVAVLRVGGALSNTFVELTGDDVLSSTRGAGEPVDMYEQELIDYHSYRADFDDDEPDIEVEIAFERTVDDGAPSSVMSLPAPFTLDPPAASYSRDNDDIVLTWDNQQSDEIKVWVVGECIEDIVQSNITDAGTYTIAADTIEPTDPDAAANCEIEISVWRERAGQVDPGYGEGGVARGQQLRQVKTLSTP